MTSATIAVKTSAAGAPSQGERPKWFHSITTV